MIYRDMIIAEIKSITSNVTFKVLLFLLVSLQITGMFESYKPWKDIVVNIESYNNVADLWNGILDWEMIDKEEIDLDTGDINSSLEKYRDITKDTWYVEYLLAAYRNAAWYRNIDFLQEQLSIDAKKIYQDNLRRLRIVGEPTYVNCYGLNIFVQNLTGIATAFLIGVILVLLLSPIFVRDKQNSMDIIIESSKLGYRKNKIMKVYASFLLVFIIVSVYYFGFLFMYLMLFRDYQGIIYPINSLPVFSNSPYDSSILGYLIKSYLRLLLGSFAITGSSLLISEKSKSYVISIVLNLFLLLFPFIVPSFGLISKIMGLFPISSIQGLFTYDQYIGYEFGKYVLVYKDLSIGFLLLMNIISIYLICRRNKCYVK